VPQRDAADASAVTGAAGPAGRRWVGGPGCSTCIAQRLQLGEAISRSTVGPQHGPDQAQPSQSRLVAPQAKQHGSDQVESAGCCRATLVQHGCRCRATLSLPRLGRATGHEPPEGIARGPSCLHGARPAPLAAPLRLLGLRCVGHTAAPLAPGPWPSDSRGCRFIAPCARASCLHEPVCTSLFIAPCARASSSPLVHEPLHRPL
jgi:hypothetical protein